MTWKEMHGVLLAIWLRMAGNRWQYRLGHVVVLANLFACGQPQETTGTLTARSVQVQGVQGRGSITLLDSEITLIDAQGRKAMVTASGIRFFASDGKPLGDLSPGHSP